MRQYVRLLTVLASLYLTAGEPAFAEQARFQLGLGAFAFDETSDGDLAAEARFEYQSGERWFDNTFGARFRGLGPYASLNVNTDGGVFGSGGIFADLKPFPNIYLRPFGGIGGYAEGSSRDLGGVFQFEVGAAAGYRFENEVEAGLLFKHISNASIHDSNPGANSIMFVLGVPFDFGLHAR